MGKKKRRKRKDLKKKGAREGVLSKHIKIVELLLLLLFVYSFLLVKIAQPWHHTIDHDRPFLLVTNDNPFHASYTAYLKEVGNFMYSPPFMQAGYEDVVGYQPPLQYHLSAMLSEISGLETYDTNYIIIIFLLTFMALFVYFIARKESLHLALLSLPFMIGVYHFNFEVGIAFGTFPFVIGSFFLASVIWGVTKIKEKYGGALMVLLLTGTIFGHVPEFIFAVGFLVSYLVIGYAENRKLDKSAAKIVISILLSMTLSLYYLLIFKNTWMVAKPFSFSIMTDPSFAPGKGVFLEHFGLTLCLLFLGVLITLYAMCYKRAYSLPLYSGIFILLMGFTNYIGFRPRAWNLRTLWPIFLAPLMAVAIYDLGGRILKVWKNEHTVAVSLLLMLLFANAHSGQLDFGGPGTVDEKSWEAFRWVAENTPKDAKVYHFFSIYTGQAASLSIAERAVYYVDTDDYINGVRGGTVRSSYKSHTYVDFSMRLLTYKTSAFTFGHHAEEEEWKNLNIDMWDMDYYLFYSNPSYTHPAVIQYNGVIKNTFLNVGMVEVFNNGAISILKNNRKGVNPLEGAQ